MAAALKSAGLGVRLWSGRPVDQAAARAAGLTAERGKMMLDAISRETELEDVTDALLLTGNDDFNALAPRAADRARSRAVYRVAPDPDAIRFVPPDPEVGLLPTYDEMARRFPDGAQLVVETDGGALRLSFVGTDGTR